MLTHTWDEGNGTSSEVQYELAPRDKIPPWWCRAALANVEDASTHSLSE